MEKHLHIIVPRIPHPVDNSNHYDVYQMIAALHKNGVKIHLHCYNSSHDDIQNIVRQLCESIDFYHSENSPKIFSKPLPYIVEHKKNELLIEKLVLDDHPILIFGIACSYVATSPRLQQRKKFVRLYHIEFQTYKTRCFYSYNPFRRIYYWNESRLLHAYEKALIANIDGYAATCKRDMRMYHKEFDCTSVRFIPPFYSRVAEAPEGVGAYSLYFGDLSDVMHEKTVLTLLKEVYKFIHIPLVIAASNPSQKVLDAVAKHPHVHLVINPDEASLQDILSKAHIILLPSRYETGIQPGLLQALYNGRHCLANSKVVMNTGLESICHIADSPEAFRQRISQLYHQPFTKQEGLDRKVLLDNLYPNKTAAMLMDWIWGHSFEI
ncbi:glycosyltransferase [Danxiaibacter flavus]|uniref:Glycosyltransferase n=1 Tax=Danxiaibacter flavus TaxID=3049108 RepID=A0ABV3ZHU8_9BACT|nr:glycosyltransferase [Chitinophagaceae bacterium DXS]